MNDAEISKDFVKVGEMSISFVEGTEASIIPVEGVLMLLCLAEDTDRFSTNDCAMDSLTEGFKVEISADVDNLYGTMEDFEISFDSVETVVKI